MLSKCANPSCSTPFRYLRDGKIFEIDANQETEAIGSVKPIRRVEFYWLCGPCSSELTVIHDLDKGVQIVPLPKEARFLVRRAAAAA